MQRTYPEPWLVPITVGVVFGLCAAALVALVIVGQLGAEPPPTAPEVLSTVEEAVEAIRGFEKTLVDDGLDDYRACSTREEGLAQAAEPPSVREPTRCWSKIGWTPTKPLAGGYWVELTDDGANFIVHGVIDTDGDGQVAEFVATADKPVERVTPEGVW